MPSFKQTYRNLKAVLKRVDRRQRHFDLAVVKSSEERVCSYCHEHYVGRYCPQCSMDGERVKLTTRSVVLNILDAWGLGNRSMFRNIKELFWRPGYMMADYLHGRKQAYFPPVKMLFILALFFGLIVGFFDITLVDVHPVEISQFEAEFQPMVKRMNLVLDAYEWLKRQVAINLIVENIILILVAGRVFAHSPRLGFMTRTENFFVQMFVNCQMMMVTIILVAVTGTVWKEFWYPYYLPAYIVFVLLVYDFWQLFGYSLRKTVWKVLLLTGINLVVKILLVVAIMFVVILYSFLRDGVPVQ